MPAIDSQGKEIKVGQKVIYMESYVQQKGIVVKIIESRDRLARHYLEQGSDKYLFRVNVQNDKTGKITRVRVLKQIYVLPDEGKEPVKETCRCGHEKWQHFEGYAECCGGYGCAGGCYGYVDNSTESANI